MGQNGAARSAARRLVEIRAQVLVCPRCRLSRTRTTAVPGQGNPAAEVVLVGEAPGRTEDRQGEPFVGRAGKVLEDLLAAAGLRRGDVYITNVVKCRPVAGEPPYRNRPPRPDEIATCAPWLEAELEAIRPKVVCAMGRVASEYFLPGRKLTEVHGKLQHRGDLPVLPLFHPAMARWPAVKQTLFRDFKKIPRILEELRSRAR